MRAVISRIIAGPIAALVAWLIGLGLELGVGFETALTEVTTLLVLAVLTSVYGVLHKVIDKRVNPRDLADTSGRVVPILLLLLAVPVLAGCEADHRGGNAESSAERDTSVFLDTVPDTVITETEVDVDTIRDRDEFDG